MMIVKLHIMSSPADLPVQYHKQPFPTEHGYASKLVSHVFIIDPKLLTLDLPHQRQAYPQHATRDP